MTTATDTQQSAEAILAQRLRREHAELLATLKRVIQEKIADLATREYEGATLRTDIYEFAHVLEKRFLRDPKEVVRTFVDMGPEGTGLATWKLTDNGALLLIADGRIAEKDWLSERYYTVDLDGSSAACLEQCITYVRDLMNPKDEPQEKPDLDK